MSHTSAEHKNLIAALVTAGVLLGAAAAYIIFVARIGPVIYVISEAHGHGIHSGDMIGVALGALSLVCLAVAIRRA